MKTIALFAGLLLLVITPLVLFASVEGGSFAVHMVLHMGIVAVASPLLACGMLGSRFDLSPRFVWMTPLLASMIEMAAVWIWHVPAMRTLADASLAVSVLELATFLLAGLLLWLVCLRPGRDGEGRLAGTIGLLFTSMHMTLLGALLALAPRPLYGAEEVSCFGVPLSGTADQQLGGVVMLAVGAASYLAGGVVLLSGVLKQGDAMARGERRW